MDISSVRILIADDHVIVREGLRALIQARSDWEVVGEAVTGRETVERARQLQPDVVVLDFAMPELNGLEATRQIRKTLPQVEILMLTMHDSEKLAQQALAAGARGFVLKSDAKHHLERAIEALARHEPYLTARISTMLLNHFVRPVAPAGESGSQDTLTAREREIVQLIAEGAASKEIALKLGISDKTVETHRGAILRKLRLHSAVDLVRYAIRNKMIEP